MNMSEPLTPKPVPASVRMNIRDAVPFRLPPGVDLYIAESQPAALPKQGEALRRAVEDAIDETCGARLSEVIDRKKQVVLVVDDHTRGTPSAMALEVLYERLRDFGLDDDQMLILSSAGTHRRMSDEEIRAKTGSIGERLEVVQHDCRDMDGLYLAGKVEGIPVWLNRCLKGAGAVIGIGSLVAHKFSGWSGGAKIICPGVAGYETIYRCHYKSIVEERIFPGQRDNWFRRFIDTVGELAGLSFCLNFVPAIGGIAGVAAGSPRAVLDRNISCAEKAMAAGFAARADLVLVSAYPATTDLWQSGKGFYIGDMLVKDGGTLILVTPLEEGLGDHPDFIALLDRPPADILELLAGNRLSDPLAAVASYAIRRIGERCSLRIVTGNSSLYGRPLLGAPITGELQSVVDSVRLTPGSSVAVLNDSYVLPRLDTET